MNNQGGEEGGGGGDLSHRMRFTNIKSKIFLARTKPNLYICDQVV